MREALVVAGMPTRGVTVIVLFVVAVIALIGWLIRRRKAQIRRDLTLLAEMLGGDWVKTVTDDEIVERLDGTLDGRPVSVTYATGRTYPHVNREILETPAPAATGRAEVLMPGALVGGDARRRKEEARSTGHRALDRKVRLLGSFARPMEDLGEDETFRESALRLVGREYDTIIEDGRVVAVKAFDAQYFRISAEDDREDLRTLFRLVDALA